MSWIIWLKTEPRESFKMSKTIATSSDNFQISNSKMHRGLNKELNWEIKPMGWSSWLMNQANSNTKENSPSQLEKSLWGYLTQAVLIKALWAAMLEVLCMATINQWDLQRQPLEILDKNMEVLALRIYPSLVIMITTSLEIMLMIHLLRIRASLQKEVQKRNRRKRLKTVIPLIQVMSLITTVMTQKQPRKRRKRLLLKRPRRLQRNRNSRNRITKRPKRKRLLHQNKLLLDSCLHLNQLMLKTLKLLFNLKSNHNSNLHNKHKDKDQRAWWIFLAAIPNNSHNNKMHSTSWINNLSKFKDNNRITCLVEWTLTNLNKTCSKTISLHLAS